MSLREQLAFMFIDMRGFGAALESLPDATVVEVLDAYEAVVRAQAGQFGGRVVNFVGDGAFLVFENATDAVRCAVHIQQAQAWAIIAGRAPFPVAIGIHFGAGIARQGDYIGAAVHQAAHLQMRARGWETLVSWEARLAAGALPDIGYEPLEELAPGFTGAARLVVEGVPPPEPVTPSRLVGALPADREQLLELLFTLEDRLRERKREQTFLSVDVVGSTGLKEGEDTLAIEYSFRNYHRFVTRTVHEAGGKVYSTSGDGVLAAFERPEDAARAAVTLQSGLPAFNAHENRLHRSFALRCGINTGEVTLREADDSDSLFSRVIDTACNVQQVCLPGEIAVSERSAAGVRRILGDLRTLSVTVDGAAVYAWPARLPNDSDGMNKDAHE